MVPGPGGSRRKRKILIGGGITAGVLAVVAVLGVALSGTGAVTPEPAAKLAAKPTGSDTAAQLAQAVTNLSGLPGIRYKGTLAGAGAHVKVDLSVTAEGSTHGMLVESRNRVQLFSADEKAFVKGNASYWRTNGASASQAKGYVNRWIKLPASKLPIGNIRTLTPSQLAGAMNPGGISGRLTPGPAERVNGVSARPIALPTGRVYLTTASPYHIVRIETSRAGGSEGDSGSTPATPDTGTAALAGDAAIRPVSSPLSRSRILEGRLDLIGMSAEGAGGFVRKLQVKVRELRNSIDSQVSVKVTDVGNLSPCDNHRCTANAQIKNRLLGDDPMLQTKSKIAVEVTVSFRLDGSSVGSCTRTIAMRPNSVGRVSCGVSYNARTDRGHSMAARVQAQARAMTTTDLRSMLDALKKER